jgi:GntR family transcriptional regulator, phosphonate transport system regulatory protein
LRPSGVVLWQQLADQIADEIARRGLPRGARLPAEPELAAQFNVNRHTVRRAVAALAEIGLVRVEQGRGTFVERAGMLDYLIGPRTRFTEVISRQNLSPDARLIRSAIVPAEGRMAEDLNIREGENCLLIEALHSADGVPVTLAAHYFPAARFAGLDEAFEKSRSITKALRQFGVTDYLRRVTRVSTRLPTARAADLLRQARSKPVLVIEAFNVDETGIPIEYGIGYSAGERLQLVFES